MRDLNAPTKKFRPEIEGIRAVAAILVAVYHIWLGKVSGGVDVFFIVSGFLITTSLLAKIEREGHINLFEYLLGLVKRLIPLAFTVLTVTSLLSILIMPKVQWEQIISEVIASGLYYENWQLAFNSVDYLEQNNEASPLQHFWALSLQGQFYITWPLIIILSFFIARKLFKTPERKTLLATLSILFTLSISYSIYKTIVNQPWAYFDTFARVWEFSLGGIVAIIITLIPLKSVYSALIGWVGLGIICLTGVLLPVSTVFPGYAALLPTIGVILIILAAENGHRFGVEKLLGSKPLLFMGSISYGFYLWHWPLLIFYLTYFKKETVSLSAGLVILSLTFILSYVSTKVLEAPVRKLNVKYSKVKLVSIATSFALPVTFVVFLWGTQLTEEKSIYNLEDYPGANALAVQMTVKPDIEPIPSMLEIKENLPEFYSVEDCVTRSGERVTKCSFGETKKPEHTIALVGGSHSGHWFPALMGFAEELKMQIDVYNHDGCRFSNDDFNGTLTEACMKWNELVIQEIIKNPPDLVFTTANLNKNDTIPIGYIQQWEKLEGVTKVFAVRDNPRMSENVPLCLEREKDNIDCSLPRDEALSSVLPWENTKEIPSNVFFADMSDYFCDDETCYSVIGNIIVYRDAHHITAEYARTLSPFLKEHIVEALAE
ncbi:peptidoglycan/LPS O-acetylase OafA/YrhL [Ureibacillus xyleni]|uniref:Peptidoglycan/LPS O-acetylase OafA/YrhL n=1 Tax=Ureibacillus xyleni TaxID=614648 RepID=A0A285RX92_9BACL|nr:acyltransferase family protein [Ureibacillus xyleni]SOB99020.1 peptidoglycan/LPS O-acetylase OafA/YrhL [Ureibacillus xyleni]